MLQVETCLRVVMLLGRKFLLAVVRRRLREEKC